MWNYSVSDSKISIFISGLLILIVLFPSATGLSDELTAKEKIRLGLEKISRFTGNGEGLDEKADDEAGDAIKQNAQKKTLFDLPTENTNCDHEKRFQADKNSLASAETRESGSEGGNETRNNIKKDLESFTDIFFNAGGNEERNKIRTNKSPIPVPTHYTIKIPANKPWTRTGVYLKETDILRIFCKGTVMPGDFEMVYKNTSCQAEGYHFARGSFTILPDSRYMAAIGRIGNRDAFYIGSGREFVSYVNGPLYLGINDLCKSVYTEEPVNKRSIYWKDNTGGFEADVYVYRK